LANQKGTEKAFSFRLSWAKMSGILKQIAVKHRDFVAKAPVNYCAGYSLLNIHVKTFHFILLRLTFIQNIKMPVL
jgi:hypothetical protein